MLTSHYCIPSTVIVASFPGLPRLQFLIACSIRFCILQAIKNWSWGRPGNEATVIVHQQDTYTTTRCKKGKLHPLTHDTLNYYNYQWKQQTSYLSAYTLVPWCNNKSLLSPAAPPPSLQKGLSHWRDVTHFICLASFPSPPSHTPPSPPSTHILPWYRAL